MATASAPLDCTRRLADQLQALTEVAETLTLRLLDLEDRLAAQEGQLQPLLGVANADDPEALEATELRLSDTEDRLGRLESLLNAPQASGSARHLTAVQSVDLPVGPSPDAIDAFPPDEAEQPFLDEIHSEIDAETLEVRRDSIDQDAFELELREA